MKIKIATVLTALVFGGTLETSAQWYADYDVTTWQRQARNLNVLVDLGLPTNAFQYPMGQLHEGLFSHSHRCPNFTSPTKALKTAKGYNKQEITWSGGGNSYVGLRQIPGHSFSDIQDRSPAKISSHSKMTLRLTTKPGINPGSENELEDLIFAYSLHGARKALQGSYDNCLEGEPPPEEVAEAEPDSFVIVERMPEVIGGYSSVQKRVEYPQEALEKGIEGHVSVDFTVDEQGDVIDAEVTQSVDADLDKEALRVVQETRFTPGRMDGKPIKVRISLPVIFSLQK